MLRHTNPEKVQRINNFFNPEKFSSKYSSERNRQFPRLFFKAKSITLKIAAINHRQTEPHLEPFTSLLNPK